MRIPKKNSKSGAGWIQLKPSPGRHWSRLERKPQGGKLGWALLWILGVPVPILFIFFLLRGCT
jgi:hypothetical protein